MHVGGSFDRPFALATMALLAGCLGGPNARSEPGNAAEAVDPAAAPGALFAQMERRLLDAPDLHLRYTVASEGAFDASLAGTLQIRQGPVVELQAAGTFGDAPVTLHLLSDGRTMVGGSAQRTFREATPPALHEALVLGLTRMGILHNLARLTGGATPDRAAGGVEEWVEVREIAVEPPAAGADPGQLVLAFAIHVAGTRTAEARLWIDRRTGLPVRREQVVSFPGGSMRVVEHYEFDR